MDYQSQKSQPERILRIDGVINFRDLGGYQTADGNSVKWGRVYRSAQLDRLTEQGIACLLYTSPSPRDS